MGVDRVRAAISVVCVGDVESALWLIIMAWVLFIHLYCAFSDRPRSACIERQALTEKHLLPILPWYAVECRPYWRRG